VHFANCVAIVAV